MVEGGVAEDYCSITIIANKYTVYFTIGCRILKANIWVYGINPAIKLELDDLRDKKM